MVGGRDYVKKGTNVRTKDRIDGDNCISNLETMYISPLENNTNLISGLTGFCGKNMNTVTFCT